MKQLVLLSLSLLLVAFACTPIIENRPLAPETHSITLRWVKNYEEETWDDVIKGMEWAYSFMGATLPAGSLVASIDRTDSSRFSIDLAKLGWTPQASTALSHIIDTLIRTEEYRRYGAIDLGRFLVFAFYSSGNYYAVTGAHKTFDGFRAAHPFTHPWAFPLLHSSIAFNNRMIRFTQGTTYDSLAFLAEETTDDIGTGSYRVQSWEVFDFMPNGQLRYAIYDSSGILIDASPASLGIAGKPGHCLHCHELYVEPLFTPTTDIPGGMTQAEFLRHVDSSQQIIDGYRATLHGMVDYTLKAEHSYSERLYIGFMEPSLFRIRNEWPDASDSLMNLVLALPTHGFPLEWKWSDKLYYRRAIDSLIPYGVVRVPVSIREKTDYEPDVMGMLVR